MRAIRSTGADEIRLEKKLSAQRTIVLRQKVVVGAVLLALLAGFVLNATSAALAVLALVTMLYTVSFLGGLLLIRGALRCPRTQVVSDVEALALDDSELPTYTILVPAYREADVIHQTVAALEQLVYPADKLDIKFLLEPDDAETRFALFRVVTRMSLEVIVVPPGGPKTKPKACNAGLRAARGELITIYDIEDRPDALQLRRAVVAFRRLDPSVVCLQAKLAYHNAHQNLITRWFAAEYTSWFSLVLPALPANGGPVPLGGTSMHMKSRVLRQIGGWDPYNVTEDADLGIRLQRFGYRTEVLDSTTMEEANSDFINWLRQRSRWYKGYFQTWLVHMREPIRLWRQLGTPAFIRFNLIVGATPLVAVLNPVFWTLTILWFTVQPRLLLALFPPWLYLPGLISMVLGNFALLYVAVIAIRLSNRPSLLGAVMTSPLYWLMMSIAAIKALLQLVVAPYWWEKTVHGLDRREELPVGVG